MNKHTRYEKSVYLAVGLSANNVMRPKRKKTKQFASGDDPKTWPRESGQKHHWISPLNEKRKLYFCGRGVNRLKYPDVRICHDCGHPEFAVESKRCRGRKA